MAENVIALPPKGWEKKNEDGTIHYEGDLGVFDYDPNQFVMSRVPLQGEDGKFRDVQVLSYRGQETDGSKIQIPEGLVNAQLMFMNSKIESAPRIPNSVRNMDCMFQNCRHLKTFDSAIPSSVNSMSMTFGNCVRMEKGPEFVPGHVRNANYCFVNCHAMTNTPMMENGVELAECAYAGCHSIKDVPRMPSTLREYKNMTYDCPTLDKEMEKQHMAQMRELRKQLVEKMDKPTFREKCGQAFSAILQCHAMRQSGMHFFESIQTVSQMRKDGRAPKDFSTTFANYAASSKFSLVRMLGNKVGSNAQNKAQQKAAQRRDALRRFDDHMDYGMGGKGDLKAQTRAGRDGRMGLFDHLGEMGSPQREVLRTRYSCTYPMRENLINQIQNQDGGVSYKVKSQMGDWYQQQISAATIYYHEAVDFIRHSDRYKTEAQRATAMENLREISRMQFDPLLKSAESMQSQHQIFSEGALRNIDRMLHSVPMYKNTSFSEKYTMNDEMLRAGMDKERAGMLHRGRESAENPQQKAGENTKTKSEAEVQAEREAKAASMCPALPDNIMERHETVASMGFGG